MKPYSEDLRTKIVQALQRGMNKCQAARTFGVSLSSVKRYAKLASQGESLAPKKPPGKSLKLDENASKLLEANLRERPTATLYQRCEYLRAISGVEVSQSTISRMINKRLKWSRKKASRGASERDEWLRAAWRVLLALALDARRLVFVDEMGSNITLAPLYAYAPKGERAYSKVPHNRGKNITLLASMTFDKGMGECMVIEGSTTAAVFESYVENFLVPMLKEGQVVILDNLKAHKGDRVRQLIEGRGCELVFLPAYSPDLNPIEEAFSKIKGILREVGARSQEALLEAIAEAISMVTAQDAKGFFEHCGYHLVGHHL
jgi:transposase